ncbi:MAG: NAD-dependent epimerase/dehydratase family protein [Rubellimicrobium sp.]|nr:NAD-dependent epimerase/dehydratase family protein [Rubellimicrobium sp.]
MGGLSLLVTGADGFLGRAVVAAARARGHEVRRLTRGPGGDVACDLAEGVPLEALRGVARIIHCAGALTGDDARHRRDTVEATRLIAAARVPMVLAGSIAVCDGMARVVDETTPPDPRPHLRDAYTRAKIAQEKAAAQGQPLRILRLGALWGRGRLWNAHLGLCAGPLFLRLGRGEIPLSHVTNAALALVIAAEGDWSGVEIVHVVDDERPDAARYLAAMPGRPRLVLPLPFALVDLAAILAAPLGARAPGLLRRPVLHARMAPRRYDNARLHALGWRPVTGFDAGMKEAA